MTGAARGLGAAFAEELATRGVGVLALDRDEGSLDARVRTLRDAGGRAESVVVDLAAPDFEARIAEQVGDREVGLLVNNAAALQIAELLDHDLDTLMRSQRIQCDVPLRLAHAHGNEMRARGRGGIVFVSSLSMLLGGPLIAHYAATKAFNAVLAEGLFEELRGTGVDVTTVLGPAMDTPGLRETGARTDHVHVVPTRTVAKATLDALGRRARVIVGRDGHLLTHVLQRLTQHDKLRAIVADQIRAMYGMR